MFQVMDDSARRPDGGGHFRATEPVERFRLEMLTQGKGSLFWQKRVTVAPDRLP